MRAIFVAVVLTVACGKKTEAPEKTPEMATPKKTTEDPKPIAKPEPAKPPALVSGSFAGNEVTFPTAHASQSGTTLEVRLYSGTGSGCGAPKSANIVRVVIGGGPGGSFFSGEKIPPRIILDTVDSKLVQEDVPTPLASLTTEPFVVKEGNHVKGTLELAYKKSGKSYTLSGTFDAPMCSDREAAFVPLAETAATAPVSGTHGAAKWIGKSAIAVVAHDEANGVDSVEKISLHQADVDCKTYRDDLQLRVTVWNVGASSKSSWQGATQPVLVSFDANGSTSIGGDAWLRLDKVDLNANGTVSGSLVHASRSSDPKSELSGTFSATVCR
jgi:hypothetical protein